MYSGGRAVAWPHAQAPSGWHAAPVDQFHQQPPATHGRQGDALTLWQKEEQRRRQLEYSQALAEQVRQHEQRKLVEKAAQRREDAAFEASLGVAHGGDRGLFDGLGEHNPSHRSHFGRGRREPAAQQPAMNAVLMAPPMYQHPMEPLAPYQQVQGGWSGHAEALGFVEPPPHHLETMHAVGPRQETQWNGAAHPQAHHAHVQQPPPQGGGRRVRTDLHGVGNDAQTRLRQQQQQDMQESLRRQIEEKQRQKLEEKRQREEEERREMEKFEQEKRRQHDEQERIKEEKRRKALADEEHFRSQQQQLEAANAAAANDHRHHHRQRESPRPHHQTNESPPRAHHLPPQNKPPVMEKNPFTNSRAHLFQDPPSPPRQPAVVHEQNRYPPLYPSPDHGQSNVPPAHVHHHQAMVVPVDTQRLLEQYEQVRVELERQRQLVEQLHWQMQQQQQPHAGNARELPTISDLERLRQELRDELEQREAQHRDELEALRREQAKSLSKSRITSLRKPSASPPSTPQTRPAPREPEKRIALDSKRLGRRHDAFVQDALDEESDGDEDVPEVATNQRLSPVAPPRQPKEPVPTRRAANPGPPHGLHASLSASSLHCDSKLVFFDGRVQQPNARGPTEPLRRTTTQEILEEDRPETEELARLDDSVDLLVHKLGPPASHQKMAEENNQREHSSKPPLPVDHVEERADDDDSDALGFFVKRFAPHDSGLDRYQFARNSSSSTLSPSSSTASVAANKTIMKSRVQAILQDIEDDEEDGESLDGETLEAIFQRNVRRHEILCGFDAAGQHEPQHWDELNRQLQNVPAEIPTRRRRPAPNEPSLVASSRWMPSSQKY